MIGFAAFLVVCAIARDTAYPQMSLWAVVYVLYAVLMIWLGACLVTATSLEKTAGVLAACILAGALANAMAGVIQFYGRPAWLEDVVADLRGIRAYGNIAQPNLYANYLALGQAVLLFLWARGRISGVATWCAATLLVWAIALSDSRAALLYVLWFAVLGAFSARGQREGEMRRLRWAALALGAAQLAAYVSVPWFNHLFDLGPAGAGTYEHLLNTFGDLRWQAWMLALRIFAGAPIAGVGIGEFAGAAFEAGLPREMTDKFEVWTSPHNLVLQLMAETGVVGAILVVAGVGAWCWQAWRRYCVALQRAT
jgi:O-antigen ligase